MSMQPPQQKHPRSRRADQARRREGRDPNSSQDASEEDNDVSDVGSLISVKTPSLTPSTASSPRLGTSNHRNTTAPPVGLSLNAMLRRNERFNDPSESEGLESPTYDGDIESSSTIGTPVRSNGPQQRRNSSPSPTPQGNSSSLARAPTPKARTMRQLIEQEGPCEPPRDVPVADSVSLAHPYKAHLTGKKASADGPPRMWKRQPELSVEDIRAFVQRAIDGEGAVDGFERDWRTAPPPQDRPVRIYADGAYDLFHFGHALQHRQAKLSFPHVYLMVGVCSDALCAEHKSAPAMTHAERCEAVRHCRWVDEVIPDAPWVVDEEFIERYQIDYIAHDEAVYPSKDYDDVYKYIKASGKFLPTRRTPSISTSDLLERIVRGYRDGFFDSKLEKNGQTDLLAADVDWDSDRSVERRERRRLGALTKHKKSA